MQTVTKTKKLGFYGRILTIVGAVPALFVSSLSMPAIARDITNLDYWDIPILVIGFSTFIFILLITLDFWQRYFSNMFFRFHIVFILATLSILPLFALLFVGIFITQAGIVLIPLAALILVGLLLTLTEHLETGFKKREKLADRKIKLNAIFGVLIALIFNLVIVFIAFSMARTADQNVSFGNLEGLHLDGLYINVSSVPSGEEDVRVTVNSSEYDYYVAPEGSGKFILNDVKYSVDKNTKKIIFGIVSDKKAQYLKLSNSSIRNLTSNKQFVIQLKTTLPKKIKVVLLDKGKNTLRSWTILTKKKATDY